MLTYFPTPYQDEILYSILARYHLHTGNQGINTTLVDLYNTKKLTAIIDFPCNLFQVVQNLKRIIPNCQPDDLINHYTLYPFFKPFWSSEKADCIAELMRSKSTRDIHLKAGVYASGVKQWGYLRFCPKCVKEDMQKCGEAYWHRIHQLPGVLICPIHNAPVNNSKIRTYEIKSQLYYTINSENSINNIEETQYNSMLSSRLLLLSEDIKWVLDNGATIKSGLNHKAEYINFLKYKGLVSKKGQVDQIALVNEFLYFYGKDFLKLLGLPDNYDSKHNWVSMMTRRDNQEPHPLKHLLMIRFLYGSAKEYFTNHRNIEPFLNGPYPCLNVAADHYKACVISDIDIKYSRSKKPYAVFSCTCGFSYVRNGPDKRDEDKYRYDSIISYGDLWHRKFIELIERKQLHLREVSRILKIDLKTVRKLVLKFGLQSVWMKNTISKVDDRIPDKFDENLKMVNFKQRDFYRKRWQLLLDNNPDQSKTQLRGIDMKTYNWLYYHDKSWLSANSPKIVKKNCIKSKVDWGKRDIELKRKIQEVVHKLYAMDKPIRISIERIGKEIGKLYLIRNHLDKLPSTKDYIDSVCEEKNNFILRKARVIINILYEQGESPKYWRVKQMIGLTGSVPKEIEDEIRKYLISCAKDDSSTFTTRI